MGGFGGGGADRRVGRLARAGLLTEDDRGGFQWCNGSVTGGMRKEMGRLNR